MKKYISGKYQPEFPRKYIGDINNIVYRSSWELVFLRWCDSDTLVIKYSSEELVIPYKSPIDNQYHRYFVDFVVWIECKKTGKLLEKWIEIKPHNQTKEPKQRKNESKVSYAERVRTYITNISKWEHAKAEAKKRGAEFLVLTEKQIFPTRTKRKK